jgi:hypothetical protein
MLQAKPLLDDIETMRFLIVECYDGVRRPFAFQTDGNNSWFTNNSVTIIEIGEEYQIRLYNCSENDASLAIRILREQGIVCKIVK